MQMRRLVKMIDDEWMQSAPDIIGAYLIGKNDNTLMLKY
jgi:hypothetical protein